LDVNRRIARTILADQVVARGDSTDAALIVLKAHAGAGKSVILRRIAWDAARLHDKVVLYVTRSGKIDLDRFDEIFSLTNRAVFLVVDNAAHFTNPLEPIREEGIQGQGLSLVKRLSMMRIMARRMKATTVLA
jgi:hypothetical protein